MSENEGRADVLIGRLLDRQVQKHLGHDPVSMAIYKTFQPAVQEVIRRKVTNPIERAVRRFSK